MSREIKFRGKRLSDGEWNIGDLVSVANGDLKVERTFIHIRLSDISFTQDSLTSGICLHEVDPVTVGQYTGLKDKNGVDIYEGDILSVLEVSNTKSQEYTSPVEFIESGFLVTEPNKTQVPLAVFYGNDSYPLFEIEVLGNIYEHPHLLEGRKSE